MIKLCRTFILCDFDLQLDLLFPLGVFIKKKNIFLFLSSYAKGNLVTNSVESLFS